MNSNLQRQQQQRRQRQNDQRQQQRTREQQQRIQGRQKQNRKNQEAAYYLKKKREKNKRNLKKQVQLKPTKDVSFPRSYPRVDEAPSLVRRLSHLFFYVLLIGGLGVLTIFILRYLAWL